MLWLGEETQLPRSRAANRAEARRKVGRVHARIADRRHDHPHKLTTRLARENRTIVIEDLAVRNMAGNHCPARAVSDAAWTTMCGTTHDRDVNAAKNVLAEGLSVTVCGAGAGPQRSSPGGRSATKQKTPRREP